MRARDWTDVWRRRRKRGAIRSERHVTRGNFKKKNVLNLKHRKRDGRTDGTYPRNPYGRDTIYREERGSFLIDK